MPRESLKKASPSARGGRGRELREVGLKQIGHAGRGPGQGERPDVADDQEDEEQRHQGLGDLLDALGDAGGDDARCEHQHAELPEQGLPGAASQGAEGLRGQGRPEKKAPIDLNT